MRNKIYLSFSSLSEKENNFHGLKYCPEVNTNNHFWSLQEHHRSKWQG